MTRYYFDVPAYLPGFNLLDFIFIFSFGLTQKKQKVKAL
jgi:hypothetical protein